MVTKSASFKLKEARTFVPDEMQHLSKDHVQHIEKLLEVKPISKVETRSSQYHKAIINGRHPRSFKRRDLQTASLWSFVSTSSDRVKHCLAGQIVKEVAEEEVQLPQESDIGK